MPPKLEEGAAGRRQKCDATVPEQGFAKLKLNVADGLPRADQEAPSASFRLKLFLSRTVISPIFIQLARRLGHDA
jgi:hypothetical protein